jgi:O-antigen/teichoic acid export membrane protein
VTTVALTYAASAAVRLVVALWLLHTRIRWPGVVLSADSRRDLRRASLPYATQDLFSVGIARADTIIIAALTTKAIVGLYGAAYRLLEATLFISSALAGAFAAMFTYLDEDSDPPIRPVFERALKATLVLLVPCGVVLGVLAEPVLRAFFGAGFVAGADALRVLAAAVVLLGVARISSSLVVSRGGASRLVPWFGAALALNVALNLALVPPFDAAGAAAAMAATQVLLAGAALRLAARAIGRFHAPAIIAAPGLAGAAMAAAMWPLRDALLPALPLGVVAYVAAFVVVERIVSPVDLRFMVDLARSRLPSRAAA